MIYEIEVTETQTHIYAYRVEADSEAEALEKAATGDTVWSEDDGRYGEVLDRYPIPETLKVVED